MALPGTQLSDIKTVCSHAQGIAQSAEWRSTNLPDAVTEEKGSTAAAASYVAESGDKSIADLIDDIIVDIHNSGLEMTAIHDRPEGSMHRKIPRITG